ncbi:MAG: hypothetical protein HW416_3122 [Chloroflexi bacterium]|nr:hypothetical protein [Chloroflexota bacterium]
MGRVVGLAAAGNRRDAGVSTVETTVGGAGGGVTVALAAGTEGAGIVVGEGTAGGSPVGVAPTAGGAPMVAIGVDGVAASTAVAPSRGGTVVGARVCSDAGGAMIRVGTGVGCGGSVGNINGRSVEVAEGSGVAVGSGVGVTVAVAVGVGALARARAVLTMRVAANKYAEVDRRNSIAAIVTRAAIPLLSPSYQPHVWWTTPGNPGRSTISPFRASHRRAETRQPLFAGDSSLMLVHLSLAHRRTHPLPKALFRRAVLAEPGRPTDSAC